MDYAIATIIITLYATNDTVTVLLEYRNRSD